MKIQFSENLLWKGLFFGLLLAYCLVYAPYGVNETDGGFITGLAWQLQQGKILYQDIIYVRPPLPIWLRAWELELLPTTWEVLGERWIFYLKVGLYSWLAAAILLEGRARWVLATFGFVLSAHCYPAMAWHTVDGILFAVLAAFLFFLPVANRWEIPFRMLAGVSLSAALLCKQSFWPLPLFFVAIFFWKNRWAIFSFVFGTVLGFGWILQGCVQGAGFENFLTMTNGATSGGQALQHGLLDYFRMEPALALPSIGLLAAGFWLQQQNKQSRWPSMLWVGWLLALLCSYVVVTWFRQEHTVPFSQSRVLFWVAVGTWCYWAFLPRLWNAQMLPQGFGRQALPAPDTTLRPAYLLLGIAWCSSISWGYNLPILFAVPSVWGGMEVSSRLLPMEAKCWKIMTLAYLALLVLAFRVGFEFIYRDGKRANMTVEMGQVFPKLSGIYSDPASAELYQDLKALVGKYGANFAVLPSFPWANYLNDAPTPLPLDWVVNREMNDAQHLFWGQMAKHRPVIFIEKKYREKLSVDPELSITRHIYDNWQTIEETPYFIVKRL